ncbi:uncharacterized protein LOC128883541 isoform X2 [Hylaeus volcanicus]|uniref:uncharacterized protein LOC128883541 isoform X2 n=1 Tax=Hylaeus volcanicus TaxID=313075 RepID=UPI0023B8261A|nr:uncharacterized protein LOC128883541 isoform X2 [Hylaeus volcanicus]
MPYCTLFISSIFLIIELVIVRGYALSHSISLQNNFKASFPPFSLQHPNTKAVVSDDKRIRGESSFITNPMGQVGVLMDSINDAMYGETLTEKLLSDSHVQNHLTKSSLVLEDEEEGDITNSPFFKRSNFFDVYPNPFKNAPACHRPNMNESFLCDPDGLLQTHAADMIEEQLALIRQTLAQPTTECRIAVALVGELPPGLSGNKMAQELLHRWSVGNPECSDGLLLLYVKATNSPYIHWNPGENRYLTSKVKAAVMPLLVYLFSKKAPSDAIQRALAILSMEQQGGIPPTRRITQLLVLVGITLVTTIIFSYFLILQFLSMVRLAKRSATRPNNNKIRE